MPKQKPFQELFQIPKDHEKHWQGMPEYSQEDQLPFKSIYVHFDNINDLKDFAVLVNQKITVKTKSIWHPRAKGKPAKDKVYVTSGYADKEL